MLRSRFDPTRLSFGTNRQRGLNMLLCDEFITAIAAGALNGTACEPGPGTRATVTDTNGKISTIAGALDFATGAAINDGIWYGSFARGAGRLLIAKVTPSNTNGIINIGWDTNSAGAINDCLVFAAAGVLQVVANGGTAFAVGAYTATSYWVLSVMRATGIEWFIKGGAFTNWNKLFSTDVGSAAGIPAINVGSATSIFTADDVRVPNLKWMEVPLASDGFSLANVTDGAGHAEANGGAGLTWTGATWTVSGGAVSNAPTQGAELITNGEFSSATTSWNASNATLTQRDSTVTPGQASGGADSGCLEINDQGAAANANQALTLVAGTWYRGGAILRTKTGAASNAVATLRYGTAVTSGAYSDQSTSAYDAWQTKVSTFRATQIAAYVTLLSNGGATNDLIYFDAVVCKPLTLSTLFRSLQVATANVFHFVQVSTLLAGTQAGLVIRLDNAANPTKGIIVYFDGAGNIKCDEFTTAAAWTNIISGAKAFTANDWVGIWASGTAIRIYHITAAGVATLIASGTTTVTTGNLVGLFDTYGNSINAMHTEAVGTGGEYNILDRLQRKAWSGFWGWLRGWLGISG